MKTITYNKFMRIIKKAESAISNIPDTHCRKIAKTRASTVIDECKAATESSKRDITLDDKEALIVYSYAKNLGTRSYRDYYREFKLIKGTIRRTTQGIVFVVMDNKFTLMLKKSNIEAIVVNPPETLSEDCNDFGLNIITTAA